MVKPCKNQCFFWGVMWFAAMINLAFGDGLYKASKMVNNGELGMV